MTAFDLTADNNNETIRSERQARWTRVLCVLSFCSGFATPIYLLVWQSALFRVAGASVESTMIVVAACLLGLGLGCIAGRWLSKRWDVALLPLLAAGALLGAAFGLVSLATFDRIRAATAGWTPLVLVIVPTLLLGATLPPLVDHWLRRCGHVGSAVAVLYTVNALGAAAGWLVCATVLLPLMGMQGAICAAAAINGAVALVACAAYRYERQHPALRLVLEAPHVPADRKPLLSFTVVLTLAAAGGFAALSYQTFFFHTVGEITGLSAMAFAVTLGAFVLGIASGARQAGDRCEAMSREETMRRTIGALINANLAGLVFLALIDHLAWLDRGLVAAAMLMTYALGRCWGALFPCLAEFGIAPDRRAGLRAALAYLASLAGGAFGWIATDILVTGHVGRIGTGVLIVLAGLLCALVLVALFELPRWHKVARGATIGLLAVLAMLVIPHWSASVPPSLQWKSPAREKAQASMRAGLGDTIISEWRSLLGLD